MYSIVLFEKYIYNSHYSNIIQYYFEGVMRVKYKTRARGIPPA